MSGDSQHNWARLYQRLARARVGLAQEFRTDPDEKRALLRRRAQALAQPLATKLQQIKTLEILEFRLGQEHYAIESIHVREVLSLKSLTPIPGTPPFVLGIMPVRGEMIAVIDLKPSLELPAQGLAEYDKILLLQTRQAEFGILTEEVIGIRSLPHTELQSAPPVFHGIPRDFLQGMTRDQVVLLDAPRLLEDPRWTVNQKSTSPTTPVNL